MARALDHQGHRPPVSTTHRVALELEVNEEADQLEPEEWGLRDLVVALRAGRARPVRTIRGRVVDPEHDRLSAMLASMADDVEEAVDLHWLATSAPGLPVGARLRAPR